MCKFVKSSCGHLALFLALLTLCAFLALGLTPLILPLNFEYTVNREIIKDQSNSKFESFSRSRGFLFECLNDAADKASVTDRTSADFDGVFKNCILLKNFISANGEPLDEGSRLMAVMRLAYLVFYVAGLFFGFIALVVFVFGYCICCCLSRSRDIQMGFSKWNISLGVLMFLAATFFLTGVALYTTQQSMEYYSPAKDIKSAYINFPDDVKSATTITFGMGYSMFWVASLCGFISAFMFLVSSFKFKPSFDAYESNSTLSDLYEANVRSKEFRYEATNGVHYRS